MRSLTPYRALRAVGAVRRDRETREFGFGVCSVKGDPTKNGCAGVLIQTTVNRHPTSRYEITTTLDLHRIGCICQGENAVSTVYRLCGHFHRNDGACEQSRCRYCLNPPYLIG